jgi:hypothetical protein
MHAKSRFAQILDGAPGNKFDAKHVLAKRRERRRELIPFVPIQNFGLSLDENNGGALSVGGSAAEAHGGELFKLRN